MNRQKIVIVSHKYLTQPDDDLVTFLNTKKGQKVLHICHSFSDAKDRRSSYRLYESGCLSAESATRDYKFLPEPLLYLKELFYTLRWTFRYDRSWNLYIGMDGLCVLFGNLLRRLGKVQKTVFWAIDYVPENRFGNGLKNAVYSGVNNHGYRHSDQMWDLGPRMADARKQFSGVSLNDYNSHRVVPYGVWLSRITTYSYENCQQETLVFMGHLLEKQGVQLVIKAMPMILDKVPSFTFKIIGEGRHRKALEDLAVAQGVYESCRFVGKIQKLEDLEEQVALSALAVAPYVKDLDDWTKYADPGKVKTYLACGVPVLLTNVPWNAKEIENYGCGVIIDEDPVRIAKEVIALLDREMNQRMRECAREYAGSFDYQKIFEELYNNSLSRGVET